MFIIEYMVNKQLILDNIGDYTEYLHDESRLTGNADSISFPGSEAEIVSILEICTKRQIPVTIQGARTGITGGAVPRGGHILNLGRMTGIKGLRYAEYENAFYLTVEPGVLLSTLQESISKKEFDTALWDEQAKQTYRFFQEQKRFFFPPDPTETGASLGGMAASNASGARSFLYGPVRNHITAARVLFPGGKSCTIKRGRQKAVNYSFSLKTDQNQVISGTLPPIKMPEVKNASGYFIRQDMDLLDLFIGSEGTLGIITELELRLLPYPDAVWGITAFFPAEAKAVRFVREIREKQTRAPAALLVVIEYFNREALLLLESEKALNPAFSSIPVIPRHSEAAVYLEYHAGDEEQLTHSIEPLLLMLEKYGSREELTWFAGNPQEMKTLTHFRHAVPEIINLKISSIKNIYPDITKLGTDMAVPDSRLEEVLSLYKRDIQAAHLNSVIFGHIGNNHLHVNILPANPEEYQKGKALYRYWAEAVVQMGGTISAEHGVGKIKTELLQFMYGKEVINAFIRLKLLFDPGNLLNRGNLFDF